MRVRYIGDPRHGGEGPETVTVMGLSFVKGEWTPVSSKDAARFAGSSHFQTDTDEDGEPGPTVEGLRAQLTERGIKFHHKAGVTKLKELLAASEG